MVMASKGLEVLCSQQLLLLEIEGKKGLVDICCLCFVMCWVRRSPFPHFCSMYSHPLDRVVMYHKGEERCELSAHSEDGR